MAKRPIEVSSFPYRGEGGKVPEAALTERGCAPTILLAFDSFKSCLTAAQACQAAAEGIKATWPDAHIVSLPVSDGGEGMVDALASTLALTKVSAIIHNPLMQPCTAVYALSADGGTAYIESAAACGFATFPNSPLLPLREAGRVFPPLSEAGRVSYGLGELILHAISRGARRLYVGLGGTATCDGGRGLAECLRPHLPLPVEVIGVTDVRNPLYGPQGAAYVFGPQKGAAPEQLPILDQSLREFAAETVQLGLATPALAEQPGAGAAGGLGYALMAYLGATLRPGIDFMLDALDFNRHLAAADLVITGEGRSDSQTLMGKAPYGILRRCRALQPQTPVHLLSGAVTDTDALLAAGFASVSSINAGDPRPLSSLLIPAVAAQNLSRTAQLLIHNFP